MEIFVILVIAYVIIGALFVFLVLYCKWHFIRSAVESGTIRAIEQMLKKYTDLSDYMKEPLHPDLSEQGKDKPQ